MSTLNRGASKGNTCGSKKNTMLPTELCRVLSTITARLSHFAHWLLLLSCLRTTYRATSLGCDVVFDQSARDPHSGIVVGIDKAAPCAYATREGSTSDACIAAVEGN